MATPLIWKLSRFENRAIALTVFWLAFFVLCQIAADKSGYEVLVPLSLVAFLGFPASSYAAWLWSERYRSATRTGLREATATVRPGRPFPKIDLYFEDGYKFLAMPDHPREDYELAANITILVVPPRSRLSPRGVKASLPTLKVVKAPFTTFEIAALVQGISSRAVSRDCVDGTRDWMDDSRDWTDDTRWDPAARVSSV
ncbi:hypothetical protein [Amycolatopsis alba]|uniref:Uncharacterized protein n=1 Tax=Amycolatopsis alba DSM 44262 TaxID=1125972 RepID=A0A229RNS3_AMYAL|nr:hypothetical protein [Amycolatopsis alba]OXM48101.1 hypothetical protein CFP75_22380 [Amycolatopsis alba DSM 44262]